MFELQVNPEVDYPVRHVFNLLTQPLAKLRNKI